MSYEKKNTCGENVLWFLGELSCADLDTFESGEIEIVGEGGSSDVLITKLAESAYVVIEEQNALIAEFKKLLERFTPTDDDGNGNFTYEDGSEYLGEEVNRLLAKIGGCNNET